MGEQTQVAPASRGIPFSGAWNLFRAEWLKVAGNRWVAIGLMWIFPIVGVLFIALMALILSLSTEARAGFGEEDTFLWTDLAVTVWNFPNNPFVRVVILGFTAVVFAGEYQWETWKNTVPRSRRAALIVTKFFTVGVFVLLVFVITSVVFSAGWGLLMQIADKPYGPKLTGDVLRDFLGDYAAQASTTFTITIISSGYAALAGMLTRSILGGVLISFVMTVVEGFSIIGMILLGVLLDRPRIVELYRFIPTYNILNITSWINEGRAMRMDVYEDSVYNVILSDSLEFSLFVLAAWVIGVIALTALLFQRQDITR